ncbi:MAG: hypothetical protein LKI39_15060 [Bacteroides sp.]|nr:hypothetical protein [Bacteroides sp.]
MEEEKELLEYLKPLHENDEVITAPETAYYRKIGILNTRKGSSRTFFRAHNSIKIPTFEKHKLPIHDTNYIFVREDHVRRHFSTETYGVINRLKLGFNFALHPLSKSKEEASEKGKNTYEAIKFLLEDIQVKPKEDAKELALWQLGTWLTQIISTSTVDTSLENEDKIANNKGKIHLPNFHPFALFHKILNNKVGSSTYSSYVGTTAVIIYEEGDLPELPVNTRSFRSNKKYPKTDISYYNFHIKQSNDIVKFYFIKKNKCYPESYYHQLKNELLSLRVNLLCLKNIIKKINLSTSKQEFFVNELLEKINNTKNDPQYGFLNLVKNDTGEVLEASNRKDIEKRISMLKKIIVE